jgi:hypothetical protein
MKFIKEVTVSGVFIPKSAMILSGLDEADSLELHTLDDAVVLLKDSMTADEMFSVIESLSELTSELITHLVNACGPCPDCKPPHENDDDAPSDLTDILMRCGACMSKLDDLMASGEIIYGA